MKDVQNNSCHLIKCSEVALFSLDPILFLRCSFVYCTGTTYSQTSLQGTLFTTNTRILRTNFQVPITGYSIHVEKCSDRTNAVITTTRIETYFQDPYYRLPIKLTPVTTNTSFAPTSSFSSSFSRWESEHGVYL